MALQSGLAIPLIRATLPPGPTSINIAMVTSNSSVVMFFCGFLLRVHAGMCLHACVMFMPMSLVCVHFTQCIPSCFCYSPLKIILLKLIRFNHNIYYNKISQDCHPRKHWREVDNKGFGLSVALITLCECVLYDYTYKQIC